MREKLGTNFDANKLKPYAINFATMRSCGRKSKTFERSVRRSTHLFHFSIMARRQCRALISWQNPQGSIIFF